ncbi:MAG: DUF2306 domain-containing protein [Gemmataceae bacterium]
MDIHLIARWLHIGLGGCGFVLGMIAVLAPKFGARRRVHRFAGRAYAIAMILSTGLSIPLAFRMGNRILFIIGILTTIAVILGWWAIRLLRTKSARLSPGRALKVHLQLMCGSYIAAWTAFLLTNPIFAIGSQWDTTIHMFGPTVVGSILIAWYSRTRLPKPQSS